MNLSKKFEELVLNQLESFGCFMGVKHLVVYLASAKKGEKAGFELLGQWPQNDRSLKPVTDDPELKVSSPNRRWYPIQDKDILIGVIRVETDFSSGEWPLMLDSRLKALALSLSKSFEIEIERKRNDEEINYLRSQVGFIIHQLRNPLAALRTYAQLLMKRLGSDSDSLEIIESMLNEQKQINEYIGSFEKLNQPIQIAIDVGEERLLLPPNLDTEERITVKDLISPLLERGQANAILQNKSWVESKEWPSWAVKKIAPKYRVIVEIIANLLENAFKYSETEARIGISVIKSGILVFDNGQKILGNEGEKIFKKGYRGISSKNKNGSGVGLFLAKKLAKKIGGDLFLLENLSVNEIDVDIEFQNFNENNIFYLKLPIEILNK
tara:strand:- start:1916 stop:3061 length:1146 start_codon:yes stop_codon:yes gene_type:complete